MSIADRALAAYESEKEQKRLQTELKLEQNRSHAADAIMRAAEVLGIEVDCGGLSRSATIWRVTTKVDDDASLLFEKYEGGGLGMRVVPAPQLYWDLPPGQEEKGVGGGTYGCYGLESNYLKVVTLADLGRAIAKVRKAREMWIKKHGSRFKLGDRVVLLRPIERFPHFLATAGLEGEVVVADGDYVSVRLDEHLQGAEEWGNEIVWTLPDDAESLPLELGLSQS